MRFYQRSSDPPRQGVILLVVVLMLALFLVVGLSFVFYSESAASASRINMEAQNPDHVDVLPETLLSWGLGQFIYGSPDDSNGVLSAMRGHELARLMYGWNYFEGTPGVPNPVLTNALPPNLDLTQKNTNPYSRANTTPFNGIGPLRFPPIDKTGNGKSMPLPSALAAPNITDYDLVNYTWNRNDGFVRDPERAAFRQDSGNTPAANQVMQPFAGGFNAPYTYPDRANMFLAAIQTTQSYDPVSKKPINPPVALPTPQLIAQSFMRPTANLPLWLPNSPNSLQLDPTQTGGLTFWNSAPATLGGNAKSWWKYATLRPRPGDQLLSGEQLVQNQSTGAWFATGPSGTRPAFPPPADFGGDVKQLPGVPFVATFVDPNTGKVTQKQAQNDSFWMDLNYPVQISRNGRKFKPLFAFLVLDLDGRVNLNTDGNINGAVQLDPKNPNSIIFNQHASNQGLGRHEINISKILTAPLTATTMEWPQLFTGPAVTTTMYTGRHGQDQMPGNASLGMQNAIPDPYAGDPVFGLPARSLIYPLDTDAMDLGNNRLPTQRFPLPLNVNYTTGAVDNQTGYGSFPQYGPTTQVSPTGAYFTGYDNYTFDLNKPLLNPRLNHSLLNQKLRSLGDDMPFGDENMYYILGSDYKKSFLYNLIPQNLGLDGSNAALTALGNRNRQLITTRSFDLDVPGAPPWVTSSVVSNYQLNSASAIVNSSQNNYPTGGLPGTPSPMPTPTPAQMQTLAIQAAAVHDYSDFKASDGRANILSRIDLNRKLTSYYDASGMFMPPLDNNGNPLPIPAPSALATNFPLATNKNYRYFYATYDRQQLAQDIFNRLVQATGAMTPDTLPVLSQSSPATVIVPGKIGSLHPPSANNANYAATRWLAQLAVNIVDYIDDDDVITPFQWNPSPDPAIARENGVLDSGWVYGVEAPKLVINEAYCELQNNSADKNNPLTVSPYQYNFWLELYNPMPTPTPGTAWSTPNPPTQDRWDPNKMYNKVLPQDRMAVQLSRKNPITQNPYPVYQILVVNEDVSAAQQALTQRQNTDGTMMYNPAAVVAQVTAFNPDIGNGQPTAYPDFTYVQPTAGQFNTTPPPAKVGQPADNSHPSNAGFYVIAPDTQHPFAVATQSKLDQPSKLTLTPTMYLKAGPTENLPATPWAQPADGTAVNALTYTSSVNPPSTNPDVPGKEGARKHTVMLRRLACPYLDPNPMMQDKNKNLVLVDPAKPFNPYVTVDFINHLPTVDAVQYLPTQSVPNPNRQHYQPVATRHSVGRVQPYNASVMYQQNQAAQANPIINTFFMHNNPNPPTAATNASVNTPKAATDATMDWPFDWLTFADRPLTNVTEILNVPSTPPHLLTQVFGTANPMTQIKDQHLAPWKVQDARIYRALEFFTVGDRSPYPGTSGRVAGKIDLNTVFDRVTLDAIADPQPTNFFKEVAKVGSTPASGAVTDAWQGSQNLTDPKNVSFLNRKQSLLGIGTVADSPFMSLAAPVQTAGTDFQYPTGSGLANTLLPYLDPDTNAQTNTKGVLGTFYPTEVPPAGNSNTGTWPSLNYNLPTPPRKSEQPPQAVMNELLTKISGHTTNRSNTFAVFLTVGFFEVIDDTTLPVKLGAEITTAGGKTLRHQMFAIVDRTNLALATNIPQQFEPTADPTAGLRQAPTPPVFMSVLEGIQPGECAPANPKLPPTPITVTIAGGLPIDYDGVTPNTFKPFHPVTQATPPFLPQGTYQWMFLDMGANQEPVQVSMADPQLDPTGTTKLQLLFPKGAQFSHPGGALLCTFQPGNPGPQGPIDYNSPQYKAVVPYTYIIQ